MIFPSTLIIGTNSDATIQSLATLLSQINNEINPNNPDIFIINDQSGWSIDVVRQLKSFLSRQPVNHPSKAVIIYQANKLNTESQNALLKILEEPPENCYLILIAPTPGGLLPTILSRCHQIHLKKNTSIINAPQLIFSSDIKKNLETSERLSQNKEDVLPFLRSQLETYQQLLIKSPSTNTAVIIKKIHLAIQMIESNVDPKSALDYLFLS